MVRLSRSTTPAAESTLRAPEPRRCQGGRCGQRRPGDRRGWHQRQEHKDAAPAFRDLAGRQYRRSGAAPGRYFGRPSLAVTKPMTSVLKPAAGMCGMLLCAPAPAQTADRSADKSALPATTITVTAKKQKGDEKDRPRRLFAICPAPPSHPPPVQFHRPKILHQLRKRKL